MPRCAAIPLFAVLATVLPSLSPAATTTSVETDAPMVENCIATHAFTVGASRVTMQFDDATFAVGVRPICAWTVRAATTVADYFGRFPVPAVDISLRAVDGAGVNGGSTYPDAGTDGHPLSNVRLGRAATQSDLDNDWVMTHELVHLAVPSVPRSSHWLEEGIATYVEPVARARRGELDPKRVWSDMLHGMPKGQPAAGDAGLDRTPTWGRTYWGGALFCLLADVRIRERTANRFGLRDALRGVLAAGGSMQVDWTVDRWIAVADAAVGVPVLAELHATMGRQPAPVNLDALWKRLGVVADGNSVRFVDDAELAAVRRAIAAPPR